MDSKEIKSILTQLLEQSSEIELNMKRRSGAYSFSSLYGEKPDYAGGVRAALDFIDGLEDRIMQAIDTELHYEMFDENGNATDLRNELVRIIKEVLCEDN